jgi:5-methylcytosine-specific restriction endonuclease McrA
MPTRLCLHPRCPEPAAYRGRCAQHSRQREQQTHSNKGLYNTKRWKLLRRRVLFEQPLCPCGQIARDVHHKQDLADGGDPWARGNLEALCGPCHSRITNQRLGTK